MINFYAFTNDKLIVISDLPTEKIKSKFGHRFEIVNTIKDKSSLDIVKPRVLRQYPSFQVKEQFKKTFNFPPERNEKIRQAKLGKKRDEATKLKISQTMKGKSNFEGKKHSEESKKKTSEKLQGNQHVSKLKWVYSPSKDKEMRVKKLVEAPNGFKAGRSPEIQELLNYNFEEYIVKPTRSPRGRRSSKGSRSY